MKFNLTREIEMRYLIVLLLAGCETAQREVYWEKPGSTQQEFHMDSGQCRAQAFGSFYGPVSFQAVMVFQSCMQGRGWYQVERRSSVSADRAATGPREAYKECNDEAERVTATRDIFNAVYKDAYDACMRRRAH